MSSWKAGFRRLLDEVISGCALREPSPRRVYFELIQHVRSRSRILSAESWSRSDADGLRKTVRGISRLAACAFHFRRFPVGWDPPRESPRNQFRSLAEFLLVRYPTPRFLSNVWFGDGPHQHRDTRLFMAIGNGARLSNCNLPVPVTRVITRHFLQAPHDVDVNGAIRWAQVKARGGSDRLARALLNLLPVEPGGDDSFWNEVIGFFVKTDRPENGGPVNPSEMADMIQFVDNVRRQPASEFLRYRVPDDRPMKPDFTLRGRTLRSLRRWIANWRVLLAEEIAIREADVADKTHPWTSTGIGSFHCKEGEITWTISELRTAREIGIEGMIMCHCVGWNGYIQQCAKGQTSIWSLRKSNPRTSRRLVTIEVDPHSRVIIQKSGKSNSPPTPQASALISKWAIQEGLVE